MKVIGYQIKSLTLLYFIICTIFHSPEEGWSKSALGGGSLVMFFFQNNKTQGRRKQLKNGCENTKEAEKGGCVTQYIGTKIFKMIKYRF